MHYLTTSLEIKSLTEEGRFAGYASLFGNVDNQKDVMERGAFARTLHEKGTAIKLLWQHRMDEPIGQIDRLFEDDKGLYVEGRLLLSLQRGREAYDLVKSGALEGLSIGYRPVKYRIDPQTGIRHLQQVDLYEISLVTFPANAAAGITVVKSGAIEEAVPAALAVAFNDAIARAIASLHH